MQRFNRLIASLAMIVAIPFAAFAADDPIAKAAPSVANPAAAAPDSMSDGEIKKLIKTPAR